MNRRVSKKKMATSNKSKTSPIRRSVKKPLSSQAKEVISFFEKNGYKSIASFLKND